MRLQNVDRVIAFKFPAYYLPHDNKFLWLVHQFRQGFLNICGSWHERHIAFINWQLSEHA